MRALPLLFAAVVLAACSNNSSVKNLNPTNPTNPTSPTTASFAGTWVGTATDSTGAVMRTSAGGTVPMTWVLTQTGAQVSGNISVAGVVMPVGQTPSFSGTVSGNTMTFAMTLPQVSNMPSSTSCSATANGTMTLSSTATTTGATMAGSWSGSSTCVSGFSTGQISMTRQ